MLRPARRSCAQQQRSSNSARKRPAEKRQVGQWDGARMKQRRQASEDENMTNSETRVLTKNQARWARYRAGHREERAAASARWHAAHPGYKAAWEAAHPGYKAAYAKSWNAAHPGYYAPYGRDWRAAHPGYKAPSTIADPERRARLKAASHLARKAARQARATGVTT